MGYNLKMPWDLAELKKDDIPAISPSTSSFGAYKSARDCLVDLKLGRLGDPGEGLVGKFRVPHASAMDPPSGPSRKARGRGNGAQVPSCLVDGCRSDLSTCRDYHRRHKVCEVHSKTPIVTIGGQERRFCQQCSRFHSLVEFDEGKRSCRKRLDGHNRRRRKPQPQSITLNPGRFLSNHPGARYLPFSNNPQVCATTRSLIKAENDPMLYSNSSHSLVSFAADRKNPFPVALPPHSYTFSQGATSALPGDSLSQAFPDPDEDGLNRAIASDHHRALSLLSSPPPSKTREFGFGSAVHANASSLISFSGYSNLRPPIGPEGDHFLDSDGGANVHSEGTLRPDWSASAVMPHQTLFFSWE